MEQTAFSHLLGFHPEIIQPLLADLSHNHHRPGFVQQLIT
jgi:hypothetical protein